MTDSNGRRKGERYNVRPYSKRQVLILATLDTKPDEARFLAQAVRARGQRPWIVDIGTGGTPGFDGDTSRDVVARAAGLDSASDLAALPKAAAMRAVVDGATSLVREMLARQEVGAVLAIGGGQGTWLATAVMRALPLGFPKVMLSTAASRDIGPFVGHSDIMMLPSVTDIAGLHSLLRPILQNAAAAACGMAASAAPEPADGQPRPRLALSMFGITTTGGTRVRTLLEAAGYEVVVFHANGTGGATLEELTRQGLFVGVVDLTITELADELVGGIRSAGPERLEAAGAAGLPQVVVPGGLDAVNFGPLDSVPRRFHDRPLYCHTPETTLVRTSEADNSKLGALVARKLNAARGPVRVLIPQAGFSALDASGGVFEDQSADRAFSSTLAGGLRPDIVLDLRPDHINDAEFAHVVAEALQSICSLSAHTVDAGGS